MWIIGDCQGEFDTVVKVLKKCERLRGNEPVIFIGDIVDRGPKSKELVSFVRERCNEGDTCLMGNHEHMLIDFIDSRNPKVGNKFYSPNDYYPNGGSATLKSYLGDEWTRLDITEQMKNDVEWMRSLPLKVEFDDVIITHAPLSRGIWDQRLSEHKIYWTDIIWNRSFIAPHKTKFQIFGHNGRLKVFDQKIGESGLKTFAVCCDDTRNGNITAIHWPSMEIVQEKY